MNIDELGYYVIAMGSFAIVCFFAQIFESSNKAIDLIYKSKGHLSLAAISLDVIFALSIWAALQTGLFEGDDIYIIGFCVKIIVAFYVAAQAEQIGRSPFLWGMLGCLNFTIVLITLDLSPKFLSTDIASVIKLKELNSETKMKLKQVEKLKSESILNPSEGNSKISAIMKKYKTQLSVLAANTQNQKKETYKKKIDEAFKSGILTEEEYQNKTRDL